MLSWTIWTASTAPAGPAGPAGLWAGLNPAVSWCESFHDSTQSLVYKTRYTFSYSTLGLSSLMKRKSPPLSSFITSVHWMIALMLQTTPAALLCQLLYIYSYITDRNCWKLLTGENMLKYGRSTDLLRSWTENQEAAACHRSPGRESQSGGGVRPSSHSWAWCQWPEVALETLMNLDCSLQ